MGLKMSRRRKKRKSRKRSPIRVRKARSRVRLPRRKRPKETCAICMEEMPRRRKDDKCVMPKCSDGKPTHRFHEECLLGWLERSRQKNCPLCRADIRDWAEEKYGRDFNCDEDDESDDDSLAEQDDLVRDTRRFVDPSITQDEQLALLASVPMPGDSGKSWYAEELDAIGQHAEACRARDAFRMFDGEFIPERFTSPAAQGASLLMLWAQSDLPDEFGMFLFEALDVPVRVQDADGDTALHYAANAGEESKFHYLWNLFRDIPQDFGNWLDAENYAGDSAIQVAEDNGLDVPS